MNSDKTLTNEYVRSYYDTFLSKYDGEYAHYRWQAGPVEKLHFRQTKRTLMPYLKATTGAVLEIGGGDGIWTREYIDHVDSLVFLDISKEMIARAQKRFAAVSEKISYVCDDFLQAEISRNHFNTVVSIRNLEYFTDKQLFFSRVHSALTENGRFVLVTKSPQYNRIDVTKEKVLHHGQTDIIELIKMMQQSGFCVVAVYPAIFGKLFRFSVIRVVSTFFHRCIMHLPWKLLPLRPLSYLSESFLIYAEKK